MPRRTSRPQQGKAGGVTAEKKEGAEAAARAIWRVTRKKYSAEEKVRIVQKGLRGEIIRLYPDRWHEMAVPANATDLDRRGHVTLPANVE